MSLLRPALEVALAPGEPTGIDKDARARIAENVRWTLQHSEVNDYYYLYGLHQEGAPPADHFLSVREMMNMLHRQVREDEAGSAVGVFKDKFLFSLVAQALGRPSPRVLAFFEPDGVTWLAPREKLSYDALPSRGGAVDGFVKPLEGRQAAGAFALRIENGALWVDGRKAPPGEVQGQVAGRSILQERVVQHEALAALHAPSVNTVRLVTTLRNGAATPLVAALRVGVGGRTVDNWSAGGLVVGVDLETGRLYGRGLYKPARRDLLRDPGTDRHPDSGVTLDGYELPTFREAAALACDFHRDLGAPRSVGWDLAITPYGPTVVEGNTFWNGAMFMALDSSFKARYIEAVMP